MNRKGKKITICKACGQPKKYHDDRLWLIHMQMHKAHKERVKKEIKKIRAKLKEVKK